MLVWDAFRAHLVDSVKAILREDHNTHVAVIPGGLTSLVQPSDVCLNKPFKDRLRRLWTDWMMSGEMSYTAGGNICAAPLTTVVQWVKEAWADISSDMGISNTIDGTEDDMLWEEEKINSPNVEDAQSNNSEDDVNPYDDNLTCEAWKELFGGSDEEETEFIGFER